MDTAKFFQGGFIPALIGGYFNIVELLSQYAQTEQAELGAVVQSEIPRLRETGQGTVGLVREVQALAREAGIEDIPPPRFPSDYYDWYSTLHGEFAARLELHSPSDVAFRIGKNTGSMLCSLNVAGMTILLLQAAPEMAELKEQLVRLLMDIRETLDDLRISARNPNAPEGLWSFALEVTDAVDFVNIARRVLFAGSELKADELPAMGELLQKKMSDIRSAADDMVLRLRGTL